MTQNEIIEMAKEAGFERLGVYAQFGDDWVGFTEELVAFAKLVAAKEREAFAKWVDHILKEGGGTWGDAIRNRGEE
jgi:hypothetical protein